MKNVAKYETTDCRQLKIWAKFGIPCRLVSTSLLWRSHHWITHKVYAYNSQASKTHNPVKDIYERIKVSARELVLPWQRIYTRTQILKQ